MSRLQKKCLLASSGLHLFGVLLLMFGSAFFVPKEKTIATSRIQFVPAQFIENALAGGGGNPNIARTDDVQKGDTLQPQPAPPADPVVPKPAQPAPPTPAPPVPEPAKTEVKPPTPKAEPKKTERVKKTEPKPEPVTKPTKPVDAAKPSTVTPTKSAPTLAELLKPVVRTGEDKAKAKAKAEAEARERAERAEHEQALADARAQAAYANRVAKTIGGTAAGLREGFASGTKVDVGGPGGTAFADYRQFVQAVFDEAWILTRDITTEDAAARVSVTISRNGTVINSQIIRRSGVTALDRSVQRALDKVKFVRPFPEASKDEQRTFTIEFNLKEKRLIG